MGGYFSKIAHSADDGEGWKRYLTAQEQESVLQEAQLIQQGYQPECHRKREGSAIFWASISGYPLRCKLAELLAALENGTNPNEEESVLPVQARSGRLWTYVWTIVKQTSLMSRYSTASPLSRCC